MDEKREIGADGARFLMLAIYCTLSMMNSAMWNTFAPISDDSEIFFDVSASAINWLCIVWSVVYVFGTALGIYWFHKYALRETLLLCGYLTTAGAFLRYIAVIGRESLGSSACYTIVFLGMVLIGLGQPIVVNLATGMASIWYPTAERDRATTVGTIFNPLGNAIGSILPPLIVYSTNRGTNDDTIASTFSDIHGMDTLMLVQFLMALVSLILIVLFFRAQPAVAPSYSEAHRDKAKQALKTPSASPAALIPAATTNSDNDDDDDERQHRISRSSHNSRASRASRSGRLSVDATAIALQLNEHHNHTSSGTSLMWTEFKDLISNREYMLLLLSFSIGLGLVNAVLTLVFQLVSPVGYSNEDAGWFSFMLIVVGMIGAAPMSIILEKTRAYRAIYSGIFTICLGSVTFFVFMLYPDNFSLLLFAFGLMGMTIIPLFPACLENTAECTYPISEDISVGVLLTAGNLGTIVITTILQNMIEISSFSSLNLPWNAANIFIIGALAIGTLLAVLYKGDSKRYRADVEGEEAEAQTQAKNQADADARALLQSGSGTSGDCGDGGLRNPLLGK